MWWVVAGFAVLLAVVLARTGGGALGGLGAVIVVVGIVAAVRTRPAWGPLASRKVGIGVAVAGFLLMVVGAGPSAASDPAGTRSVAAAAPTTVIQTMPTTVVTMTTAVVTTTVVSTAPAPPPTTATQTETVTVSAAAAVVEPAAIPPATVPVEPDVAVPPAPASQPPVLQSVVPQTQEQATSSQQASVSFANCTEAWDAGAAPIRRGEPGYAAKLDRNDDGVACEERP